MFTTPGLGSELVRSPAPDLSAQPFNAQVPSAQGLLTQGREHYNTQRFTAAADAWAQAAALFASDNNRPQQALALSYLTATEQQLGQWEAANTHISQSIALISELGTASQSPAIIPISAQIQNTLGSLQFAQGRTQLALETWQSAEALYLQLNDQSRYFNNLLNQVQAQQVLGFYHQAGITLATLERTLPDQSRPSQIRGYQRLGQTYRLIGDFESAIKHLNTALNLGQQEATDTAAILIELGNTAQSQGEFAEAVAYYQQALEQPNTPETQIKAQLNRLQVLSNIDPVEARRAISPLSAGLAKIPPGRRQTYAYIHGAQSLVTLGAPSDLETAARWLAQAIQTSSDLQDSRAEAYARGTLGHIYEKSQRWSEAQNLTEDALTTAQAITAADIAYQWQWQLGRLLKQQNKKGPAIQAYRAAYATLQSIKQDLVATNQDLQFSFRDRVEPVYRELVDLLLQPDASNAVLESNGPANGPEASNHTLSVQAEARNVIESLQVAELDNFFRTACLEGQQVALEEVEKTDAAIIYPIILRDRLEILVSLPDQPLQQYTSLVTQTELEQTLSNWRQNLERPFTTPEGKTLGESLYEWIIQPMHSALAASNVRTLTFVLDGALRNVPMAALYHDGHYLLEDYAVALSPGLQLLGPKSLQETSSTALLGGLTQARLGFSELSNVEQELRTVESLVSSRLLIDETFTTTNLAKQVTDSNQPIIHLATHGQFSSNADQTFILAWDRPILVTELSALLRSGDLNRPDPIELLILSACETATGDNKAALGLAGVALQSGTRSTLASLWNLDDASGAVLIGQFYEALARPNTTKAEALRQAQLSLLKNPNYRHPLYWSAYVLVGNWL
ncbi:MAG: CHAT domain-containing protein [Cyanobacteria bacterium J06581_3]